MKQHGAGWVILEESYREETRTLVSILPARKSSRDVAIFLQQVFIDRTASIDRRLSYKKSPKSEPYKVMMGRSSSPMHVGHDPFFVAIYAHKILLGDGRLEFFYRILVSVDDKLVPTFEERRQSLPVDA